MVRAKSRVPAPSYAKFSAETKITCIGNPVNVEGTKVGTIVGYKVIEDGAAIELTLDIDDDVTIAQMTNLQRNGTTFSVNKDLRPFTPTPKEQPE